MQILHESGKLCVVSLLNVSSHFVVACRSCMSQASCVWPACGLPVLLPSQLKLCEKLLSHCPCKLLRQVSLQPIHMQLVFLVFLPL